ncbi:MAG TPA: SpoIIE family protein phosphatase [Actinomycetota bacterium]|nr:SpoIIE family protein phosphatase [Actinomycetota bacterium]
MRLSLRWKLVGGFGLMLTLIAVLGWVTYALFGSFRNVQRKVFNDAIPGLIAVDEMVRSYTAQSAAVRGYLIGSEIALLDQYNNEVSVTDLWDERAASLFTAADERRKLDQLEAAGEEFQDLVDNEVIPLAREGKRSQAFRVLSQEGTPLIARIETLGGELANAQDLVVSESQTELRLRANQTLVILLIVTVSALGIGVFLAVVLPRRLSRNISKLVEATRAIGRGDFNQTIDIRSGDEVEELAGRLREMQSGLQRLQQLALQDKELEIAASIQHNLLQRTLPDPPGIKLVPSQRLANLVGGDWYDVDLSGRLLTVVVGDASGKGIAAALMATVALSVLRAERGLGAGPKRILERANQALKDATDPESFTTCVYATIDHVSGEVRLLNMGHTSPFVLQAHDEAGPRGYYVEGPRNRVLGWWDDPGVVETVLTLSPGDRIVFYTDGFLEAKSAEGEVFGEHRLADALFALSPLGCETIVDELLADVERFAAGKLDDDLTMLVLEFRGLESQDLESQGSPARAGISVEQTGEQAWPSRR